MEERIKDFLTSFAALFLKFIRGVNDQRIIGFVAIGIGVLNIILPASSTVQFSTITIIRNSLSIDTRIFVDLMIISGVALLLSNDISSRWFLALTIPLQIYVITAFFSGGFARAASDTASSPSYYIKLEDFVIAILIYRHLIKLSLLEVINSYNRDEEKDAEHNTGSIISSSDSWFPGSIIDDIKGNVTSDNPMDQKPS